MKRTLEPKPEKRASVNEVLKYINDKWLVKLIKRDDGDVDNQSCCYSTYSMHSSKLEKDKILKALKDHGIETTVDRAAKRKRIHDWLERSITSRQIGIEEDERSIQTPSITKTASSPVLPDNDDNPTGRSKLANISSMNNILDEGYQTGSSSNNSSIKVNQINSTLTKSTGNIDGINERIFNSDAQFIIQSIQEQRRGSPSLPLSSDITVNSPVMTRRSSSKNNQLPHLQSDGLTAIKQTSGTIPYSKAVLQPAPLQHSGHYRHGKDPNQLVKEHNQLITQQQQIKIANSQIQNLIANQITKEYQHNTQQTSQHTIFNHQQHQQSLNCSSAHNSNQLTVSHASQHPQVVVNRSRPRDRQPANNELDHRSRSDNVYYATESPNRSVAHQPYDEATSDSSSISSVIVRIQSVGA